MIPKKLHRIWFGDRPIPCKYEEYWAEWQELHPGWEFTTWRDDSIPEPINQRVWQELPKWARSCGVPMTHARALAVQQADVMDYELLYRYGGVYINCDVRPLRSIEPLLEHRAFVGMVDEYHVSNSVMGAEAGSPYFGAVIAAMDARWNDLRMHGMEIATGPQLMTAVWRERTQAWPDLTILDIDAFYPVHYDNVPYGSTGDSDEAADQARASGSYTLHAWGHRWQEGDASAV